VATSVGAAAVFGVYLFVYKRSFAHLPATVYLVAIEAVGLAWYLPVAALTWPRGRAAIPPDATLADAGLLGGVCVAVAAANLVSVRAFKLGDVSYVAPLNKLVPAFVVPIELVALATTVGPLQVAGVGLAVVAIYVANYEGGNPFDPFRRAAAHTPARLALAGAVLFAVGDVGIRAVLSTTSVPPQVVAAVTLAAVAVLTAPLAAGRLDRPQLRAALPGLVALGALFAAGVHLATVSFAVAPASVVSPIVNTQAVIAVLLGGLALGERGLPRRLAAAVLAVGGITLVAVG
jgi:drug/metabolite transporter (DMT)-like permease